MPGPGGVETEEWACVACTLINAPTSVACEACGGERAPKSQVPTVDDWKEAGFEVKPPPPPPEVVLEAMMDYEDHCGPPPEEENDDVTWAAEFQTAPTAPQPQGDQEWGPDPELVGFQPLSQAELLATIQGQNNPVGASLPPIQGQALVTGQVSPWYEPPPNSVPPIQAQGQVGSQPLSQAELLATIQGQPPAGWNPWDEPVGGNPSNADIQAALEESALAEALRLSQRDLAHPATPLPARAKVVDGILLAGPSDSEDEKEPISARSRPEEVKADQVDERNSFAPRSPANKYVDPGVATILLETELKGEKPNTVFLISQLRNGACVTSRSPITDTNLVFWGGTASGGLQVLHLASRIGDLALAEVALLRGAPVNAKSAEEYTPLHEAVWNEHVPLVRLLLKFGADPDIRCAAARQTSLLYAAEKGNLEIVKMFLAHRADVNAQNGYDRATALHMATANRHWDVVEELCKAPAFSTAVSDRMQSQFGNHVPELILEYLPPLDPWIQDNEGRTADQLGMKGTSLDDRRRFADALRGAKQRFSREAHNLALWASE